MNFAARTLSGALATISAVAITAPAAHAARPAPVKAACPAVAGSQAFAAWGDKSTYAPVPGGDFEGGAAGWSLAGSASVVADDGPLTLGAKALELRQGASATSPTFCVGMGFPYSRMFARGSGTLRVEALRMTATSQIVSARSAGNVASRSAWDATRRFSMSQGLTHKYGPLVRLRFTAARGTVRIDDVLVDPRLSR